VVCKRQPVLGTTRLILLALPGLSRGVLIVTKAEPPSGQTLNADTLGANRPPFTSPSTVSGTTGVPTSGTGSFNIDRTLFCLAENKAPQAVSFLGRQNVFFRGPRKVTFVGFVNSPFPSKTSGLGQPMAWNSPPIRWGPAQAPRCGSRPPFDLGNLNDRTPLPSARKSRNPRPGKPAHGQFRGRECS